MYSPAETRRLIIYFIIKVTKTDTKLIKFLGYKKKTYIEFVVFQYMFIVFAQLLTVDNNTVWRQTINTKVTKDVETMMIL